MSIHPLPFGFPFHVGHHRALSRVPELYSMFSLIIYFIHSLNSVYASIPISQFLPPSLPTWCPYICSLPLCHYSSFANKITSTIFAHFLSCVRRTCLIFPTKVEIPWGHVFVLPLFIECPVWHRLSGQWVFAERKNQGQIEIICSRWGSSSKSIKLKKIIKCKGMACI